MMTDERIVHAEHISFRKEERKLKQSQCYVSVSQLECSVSSP